MGEAGHHACYWKDGVLHTLDTSGYSYVNTLQVIDGVVFIAGNLNDNGEGCYWKDGVRVDIPTPEGMNMYVSDMTVVKKQ